MTDTRPSVDNLRDPAFMAAREARHNAQKEPHMRFGRGEIDQAQLEAEIKAATQGMEGA